ncbi:MAG: aminotransferase [Candidatus Lumbricidophila eiseniae]|uniref:Aromatic amino acid aminotransferase n=1 Tax=Candidatus Lumbricidiphila eiseniae TaxID=1969409 RepID=A0A2A6FRU5_9MICO|nr:MAG: aminotransferase [Candidatus Lumbricidophila eiseniae]
MTVSEPTPSVIFRSEIAALPPYRQGRLAPTDGFKLSSNENPFPPLPSVLQAVADSAAQLNRYPDATALTLREHLATRFSVSAEQVMVGAGSVSLLAALIQAAAGPGDEVVYAWRSFEAYPGLVTVAGARSIQVPNRPDHGHDLGAMAAAVTARTRVVLVCSPNNPTGVTVSLSECVEFMAAVPPTVLVILDEAYVEFVCTDSAVDGRTLLGRYPNLVIMRTFSKAYGLAGLRVGYAVGPRDLLDAARSAAIPLQVTGLATAAAIASLAPDAEPELRRRVSAIAERRDRLRAGLCAHGWSIPQAEGNFLWLPTGPATTTIAEQLWQRGLIVRPFVDEGIRLTVGEEESVPLVLTALADSAPSPPPVPDAASGER